MALFSDTERTRTDRQQGTNESAFAYLDTLALSEAYRVRRVLEQWYQEFPEDGKPDILGRFRDSSDKEHGSAFFELYCHALLHHHNIAIKQHLKADSSKNATPDFLAGPVENPLFYWECTTVSGKKLTPSIERKIGQFCDMVNTRVSSPNFSVSLDFSAVGKDQPDYHSYCWLLRDFLQCLEPKAVEDALNGNDHEALTFRWLDAGWNIEAFVMPRAVPLDDDLPLVIFNSAGGGIIDCQSMLHNSLRGKIGRYGQPNRPYIVALNDTDVFIDDRDLTNVLFGTQRFIVDTHTREITMKRGADGLLGSRNRRISALLFAKKLDEWSIAHNTPVLWHNPWARHPLSYDLWKGPQMIPSDDRAEMTLLPGAEAWKILGLQKDWPKSSELYDC